MKNATCDGQTERDGQIRQTDLVELARLSRGQPWDPFDRVTRAIIGGFIVGHVFRPSMLENFGITLGITQAEAKKLCWPFIGHLGERFGPRFQTVACEALAWHAPMRETVEI